MKSPRRGFSLIELVTAMAIFSVVFGTVLLTIHVMFSAQDGFREGFDQSLQQSRFAAQWRADVHEAYESRLSSSSDANASSDVLTLSLPDNRTIDYRLLPGSIERVAHSAQTTEGRETFRVSPLVDRGWVIDTDRATPMVSLLLNHRFRATAGAHQGLLPIRLDAVAGLLTTKQSDSAP